MAYSNTAETARDPEVQRAIQVLAGYLGDPDHLYRLHAAWALGRIADSAVPSLLQHQLERERNDEVRSEIQAALTGFESMGR